jgi:hypothetical protein
MLGKSPLAKVKAQVIENKGGIGEELGPRKEKHSGRKMRHGQEVLSWSVNKNLGLVGSGSDQKAPPWGGKLAQAKVPYYGRRYCRQVDCHCHVRKILCWSKVKM